MVTSDSFEEDRMQAEEILAKVAGGLVLNVTDPATTLKLLESFVAEIRRLTLEAHHLRCVNDRLRAASTNEWTLISRTKFDGFCKICKENYHPGDAVYWRPAHGAVHARCGEWVGIAP